MSTTTTDRPSSTKRSSPKPSAGKPASPRPASTEAASTKAASTKMDPRIRARRVAVRRGEGRRRLRRLVVLVIVACLVGVGYLVTRSPLLDVDHVRVSGAERSGADAVAAIAGIETGSPMTDAPLSQAHDRVLSLPWVESVRVERKWPGSIEIHVTERVPAAAMLGSDGALYLVDGDGWVLAPIEGAADAAAVTEVPVIMLGAAAVAPGRQQPGVEPPLAVGRMLTPDLRAWVEALIPQADGTVDLQLRQGIRVDLGSQAHLGDKLVDVATVLTRVDLAELETIDVSVVHNPVVTRKQV